MEIKEILAHVDHTLLSPTARWQDIREICDDGIKFGTASVCIPPSFVKRAKEYTAGRVAVCTVIGFPNGYNTTEAKEAEAKDAITNGADELDMVINIGELKAGNLSYVEDEIRRLKKIASDRILKVIIETCLLTEEEKVIMCKIVSAAGADFIKTSTGFSKSGATREDIALFKANIAEGVKMKAAGGIRTLADAEDYLNLGCERLGTSAIVKIVKQESGETTY